MNVVHVTHEAAEKVGGIGAVIAGLVNAEAYRETVSRTVLLGPLLNTNHPPDLRLGEGGKIFYSSVDGLEPPEWRQKFSAIERTYDVGIIYGTRMVHEPCTGQAIEAEVLLIDVFSINQKRLSLFKGELWKKFAIPSDNFESAWEFEQYVRLAEPGYEALKAIGCEGGSEMMVLLAHEYMGVPTALQAVLDGKGDVRTVFYAHEVASVRPVVEDTPGHDTMFYNVLTEAGGQGKTVEDIFPSVFANYKHPLVKAARYLDHIFAVGDYVVDELRFIDKHIARKNIDLVYNGIPAVELKLGDKQESRHRMQQYAENLLGVRPTWVMGHVCRPVVSKAIWRDLGVLHALEPMLKQRGETAVFFMLGTLAGQRRGRDVAEMERVYGWPVAHEAGYPDLCGGEEVLGEMFDCFNRDHEAIRTVLVNQWDWSPEFCGRRMPDGMTFADIRRGTDVEFGLSAYEPFGISQFEALCFGAICIVSNVCGCMGFARRAEEGVDCDCILEGNFLRAGQGRSIESLLNMQTSDRDAIESDETARLARALVEILPRDEETMRRQMQAGYEIACKMSWECVVRDYFLPALGRAAT
jgi:hypothetical protein